jgi:hypothetical protein
MSQMCTCIKPFWPMPDRGTLPGRYRKRRPQTQPLMNFAKKGLVATSCQGSQAPLPSGTNIDGSPVRCDVSPINANFQVSSCLRARLEYLAGLNVMRGALGRLKEASPEGYSCKEQQCTPYGSSKGTTPEHCVLLRMKENLVTQASGIMISLEGTDSRRHGKGQVINPTSPTKQQYQSGVR